MSTEGIQFSLVSGAELNGKSPKNSSNRLVAAGNSDLRIYGTNLISYFLPSFP
jgi:hypothetical protein